MKYRQGQRILFRDGANDNMLIGEFVCHKPLEEDKIPRVILNIGKRFTLPCVVEESQIIGDDPRYEKINTKADGREDTAGLPPQ